MDNADLILLLGIGLLAAGLALAVPATPPRPPWLPMLLGVVAAAIGLVALLVVAFR